MADRVDLVVSVECGAKQAAASIEEAARGRSLAVRTERYAADGAVDELTHEEIVSAHAALIIGGAPFGAERFAGVPLISTGAACPLTVEAAGDLTGTSFEGALGGLIGLYALNGFKILAGVIGLILANKKSKLTVALGFLLFLAQLIDFTHVSGSIATIILNIILLIIPYLYFRSALKNYKD